MDNFAATTIIVLVGMAIPILFLVGAIVFDLALGLYVLIRYLRDRTRRHLAQVRQAQADRMAHPPHRPTHPMDRASNLPV